MEAPKQDLKCICRRQRWPIEAGGDRYLMLWESSPPPPPPLCSCCVWYVILLSCRCKSAVPSPPSVLTGIKALLFEAELKHQTQGEVSLRIEPYKTFDQTCIMLLIYCLSLKLAKGFCLDFYVQVLLMGCVKLLINPPLISFSLRWNP